jgi:hypothetical protein
MPVDKKHEPENQREYPARRIVAWLADRITDAIVRETNPPGDPETDKEDRDGSHEPISG